MKKIIALILSLCLLVTLLSSCAGKEKKPKELKKMTITLDWTPNTNHTGVYVALDQGYFKDEGIDAEIIQPGQSTADALVASGQCQLGFSYQESVTMSAVQNIPLVSLAAVIQHNTSALASPAHKNIKTPKDFEGKTYAGWGTETEELVIKTIMKNAGADFSKVKVVTTGTSDFFTTTERDADFQWVYYAWDGIAAEQTGKPVNFIFIKDQDKNLDYYTPVIVTNRDMIKNQPDLIRSAMKAIAKGYEYSIKNPDKAADILLKQVPELDSKLVKASQEWLSPRYQDDAGRWGEQKTEVWDRYSKWLLDNGVITKMPSADTMYTNDFLPK
ncbi:MAG: ABC transporter substrate-binding protein [Clostridiales bacterium]|nr:ABC transporter substrate-binding protein [Clostridiales bacterium]